MAQIYHVLIKYLAFLAYFLIAFHFDQNIPITKVHCLQTLNPTRQKVQGVL